MQKKLSSVISKAEFNKLIFPHFLHNRHYALASLTVRFLWAIAIHQTHVYQHKEGVEMK